MECCSLSVKKAPMNIQVKEAHLKKHLTNQFLAVLVEAFKIYGDRDDPYELENFIVWCHDIADKDIPSNMNSFYRKK